MKRIIVVSVIIVVILAVLLSVFLSSTTQGTENIRPHSVIGGPYQGNVNSPIYFYGTGSFDIDGEIMTYEWDLDHDGNYDDANTPQCSYTWSEPGNYIISLKVTDDESLSAVSHTTVTVCSLGCDNDGICEPENNEDRFNCPDCVDRQPDQPGVGFHLPTLDKQIGDTFTVAVYLDPINESGKTIATYILNISYDSTILEYQSHNAIGDWSNWFYSGEQTPGSINYCQSMDVDGQVIKKEILIIEFKAISSGVSQLDIPYSSFEDINSNIVSATSVSNTITIYD